MASKVLAVVLVLGADYTDIHLFKQFALAARVRMLILVLIVVPIVAFRVVNFIFTFLVGRSILVARVFWQGAVSKLI